MAVLNLFFSPLEKTHSYRFGIIQGDFLFYVENGILCLPRLGDSNGNTQHTFMVEKLRDILIMPPVLINTH